MLIAPLLACVLLAAEPSSPAAWPSFLGAGASSINADSLPLKWSPSENIAWQADLPGHGQSSPVIWGDSIFVTAVEGPMKDTLHVLSFRLKDGKQRWQKSFATSDPVKNSVYVSRAAPTPVVDADRLYAFFESGDLIALTHEGEVAWQRSLSADYGKFDNEFGLGASPAQTAEHVIILADHGGPSYLTALNKKDGSTAWKTDRSSRRSWSSPVVIPVGEGKQIVVSSAGSVDGYDAASGKQLWTYDEVGGNTTVTPFPFGDGTFLVGASVGQQGENADAARNSNLAMRIDATGDAPAPTILWKTTEATPSFASPMVHAGHAYWINRSGVVYCFDAATGERRYIERVKQSAWATPLGVGERLYLFGKDGLTTVLAAGPEFKVLAENPLWDPDKVEVDESKLPPEEDEQRRRALRMFAGPVQYGAAAVSGSLLLRTGDSLVCLRK